MYTYIYRDLYVYACLHIKQIAQMDESETTKFDNLRLDMIINVYIYMDMCDNVGLHMYARSVCASQMQCRVITHVYVRLCFLLTL